MHLQWLQVLDRQPREQLLYLVQAVAQGVNNRACNNKLLVGPDECTLMHKSSTGPAHSVNSNTALLMAANHGMMQLWPPYYKNYLYVATSVAA
jgi:hypothetical protein